MLELHQERSAKHQSLSNALRAHGDGAKRARPRATSAELPLINDQIQSRDGVAHLPRKLLRTSQRPRNRIRIVPLPRFNGLLQNLLVCEPPCSKLTKSIMKSTEIGVLDGALHAGVKLAHEHFQRDVRDRNLSRPPLLELGQTFEVFAVVRRGIVLSPTHTRYVEDVLLEYSHVHILRFA